MPKLSQNETDTSDKDLVDRLFWKCQRLILARPRSECEIANYIDRKVKNLTTSNEKKIKEAIIIELKSQNLINDEAFIRWWVEGRNYFKPRGAMLLRFELAKKGVEKKLTEMVLPEILEDELGQAEKALLKKRKSLERLDTNSRFKKAINHLQRRGFSYKISKTAFDNLFIRE